MKITSLISLFVAITIQSGCKNEQPTAYRANTISSEMVLVEGGTFQMGSMTGGPRERPVHAVTLSPFYIDRYEVTHEKWIEVRAWAQHHGYTELTAGQNGYDWRGTPYKIDQAEWTEVSPWGMKRSFDDLHDGIQYLNPRYWPDKDRPHQIIFGKIRSVRRKITIPYEPNGFNPQSRNNPVTMVEISDIIKFCNARSEMEGVQAVYYTDSTHKTIYRTGHSIPRYEAIQWNADGYRLPTEAEWEFSARGGVHTHNYLYSGSDTIGSVAWYHKNANEMTHAVGLKAPNELGLYDMSGNVGEWVIDAPDDYSAAHQINPRPKAGFIFGGTRGGACVLNEFKNRSTFRYGEDGRNQWVGFRCVRAGLH